MPPAGSGVNMATPDRFDRTDIRLQRSVAASLDSIDASLGRIDKTLAALLKTLARPTEGEAEE